MKTLRDAKVGDTVTVVKLHGEGAVKRRIMGHGDHQGRGAARAQGRPSGRPMELNVRGYELSVRKRRGDDRNRLRGAAPDTAAPPKAAQRSGTASVN